MKGRKSSLTLIFLAVVAFAVLGGLVVYSNKGLFLAAPLTPGLTIFPEDPTKTGNTAWNDAYGPNAPCPPAGAAMIGSSSTVDQYIYTALTASNFAPGDFETCNSSFVANPTTYATSCTDFFYPHQKVMDGCPRGNFINAAQTVCRICTAVPNPPTYTEVNCGTITGISSITYWNVRGNVLDTIHKIDYTYASQTRSYCILTGARHECPVGQMPLLNNLHSCGTDKNCVDSITCSEPEAGPTTTTTASTVAEPPAPARINILQWIPLWQQIVWGFIRGIFGFSIVPSSSTPYAPDSQASFSVNISAPGNDFDKSDKTLNWRDALWYVQDESQQTVLTAPGFEKLTGDFYAKEISFQAPSRTGTYYLIVTIGNYDGVCGGSCIYPSDWTWTGPILLSKEVVKFTVAAPQASTTTTIPEPGAPLQPSKETWISQVWASILNFIRSLFGGH